MSRRQAILGKFSFSWNDSTSILFGNVHINRTKYCKYLRVYCNLDAWEIQNSSQCVLFVVHFCHTDSSYVRALLRLHTKLNIWYHFHMMYMVKVYMFLTKRDHVVKNAKAIFSNRRTNIVFRESWTLKSSNILGFFLIQNTKLWRV